MDTTVTSSVSADLTTTEDALAIAPVEHDETNTGITSWLGSGMNKVMAIFGKDKPDSLQTQQMNAGLMGKLEACDTRLATLHKEREDLQKAYDQTVLATKHIEAKYENNLNFIRSKLNDLRVHMLGIVQEMNERAHTIASPDTKDDDIIQTFHALVTMVEKLKTPAGTSFTQLFPHVNMEGVKVCVDYSRAIAMNKKILGEIAKKRDEETPIRKSLEEVKHQTAQVQKEVDLIREFQMRHARLSADQVSVPMVDAAPVPLIDDRHRIVNREGSPSLTIPPNHISK